MKKLSLTFLEESHEENNPIYNILVKYGNQITNYAKDYFSSIVTTTSVEGVFKEFSLYIIVPDIGFEYRTLNVEIINIDEVQVNLYTLKTNQVEPFKVNISKGYGKLDAKIADLLNRPLINYSFKFLVNQVKIKKEYRRSISMKSKLSDDISNKDLLSDDF